MSKKLDILASFLVGFGKRSDSDVINALFITMKKLDMKPPFDFESRGCLGVESKEIRKILNFSGPLKMKRNHEEFFEAGQFFSSKGSDELGWTAQYLMDGQTHLYPSEAEKAMKITESFPSLSP